ncbi:MAG: 23S rRNA (guanosine(2251)-2'-O)-methyltransferase RlmB [Saprospiraceae bacterium]|nr:23S rRNA (guanosine(2251)-2'-O)-methyltransferase RlmB [Saprospiraceae bacterium]
MQEEKQTIIFGRHPVVDAIKAGQVLDKVFLQQGMTGDVEKTIRQVTKQYSIPLQYVPKERLSKMTNGNHQGVVGVMSVISYHRLSELLPSIFEQSEAPLILLLDGITDVRNFGAIARSAVCCGVHTIVIPMKGGAQINADAMKASAGALNYLPICRENNLQQSVEQLQLAGVTVMASALSSQKQLFELDLTQATAIILGSEGEGVGANLLQKSNEQFIIPQKELTNSFNVSVAAGIILYEAMRQRM